MVQPTAWSGAQPMGPPPNIQASGEPANTTSTRMAWLEYLAHIYIEVYNFPRADGLIQQLRMLSGTSPADASMARLAIDRLEARMQGYRMAPRSPAPPISWFQDLMRRLGLLQPPPQSPPAGQYSNEANELNKSEYWSKIMGGDKGSTASVNTQTGAVFGGSGGTLAPQMRQARECRSCPLRQQADGFGAARVDDFALIDANKNTMGTSVNFGGGSQQQQNQPASPQTIIPTIHQLLVSAQLEEANQLFIAMSERNPDKHRGVFRIELVLSLIDMDMDEARPNMCVPLWEEAWRMKWQDKLRTVDVFRSYRQAPGNDHIFNALRNLPWRQQIIARIKTIVGTPDALEAAAQVATSLDFYKCTACWARLNMDNGMSRMRRILERAIHDGALSDTDRVFFRRLYDSSMQERFDPRARYFETVYPRGTALSVVSGEYTGLYASDNSWQNAGTGKNRPYRPIKNPNPISKDRSDVLLSTIADGVPANLSKLMNEERFNLVKEMFEEGQFMADSTKGGNINGGVGPDGRLNPAVQQQLNTPGPPKPKRGKGQSTAGTQSGQPPSPDDVAAEYDQQLAQYNQFRDHMTGTIDRLTAYMDQLIQQNKAPGDGKDRFGMTYNDYGTVAMPQQDHRQYIQQLQQARQQLAASRAAFSGQDPVQADMTGKMESASQAMDMINQRLDKVAPEQ